MTSQRRVASMMAIGLMSAMPAVAQTGAPAAGAAGPPTSSPATPQPVADRCAQERDWVAAEETTPGILLRLGREALAACEARQGGRPAARR